MAGYGLYPDDIAGAGPEADRENSKKIIYVIILLGAISKDLEKIILKTYMLVDMAEELLLCYNCRMT